jgi:outer membrane protein TolC
MLPGARTFAVKINIIMKTLYSLVLLIFLSTGLARGQDTVTISKAVFLEKMIQGNKQSKIAQMDAAIANAQYRESDALYLPSVVASYTAITTNNPLMAFGSKLNQEILTQEDFNPDLLNDPDHIENFATEIMVLQPLLNLDGVYARNAARIQQEAYQLKADRTAEYLELDATKLYMQLQLAYEALDVLARAQKTVNEAVRMVNDYYDQGMVQKSDVLDARVQASEVKNQLQFAITNVRNISDKLLVMMSETPGSLILKPEGSAPLDYISGTFTSELPENRKDLLAMSKSVEGYESMLQSSRMKFVPRINAFGSFQVYDDQPLGFDASGYVLGARLSWDLFSGLSTTAKVNKARLEMEKARMEMEDYTANQQAELNHTTRMLEDVKSKVELSQLAFDLATESYRIKSDRYQQGLEKTVDLLAAENQMYMKELQLKQAIFEYNFTKEYLHFLTRE